MCDTSQWAKGMSHPKGLRRWEIRRGLHIPMGKGDVPIPKGSVPISGQLVQPVAESKTLRCLLPPGCAHRAWQ